MILAGDIGGTKTVLALYDDEAGPGGPAVRQEVFPSRNFPTFAAVLAAFLPRPADIRVRAACIGVAGPVLNGQSRTTNLPWVLDERELGKALSTERVRLLNDVEAAAYGMLYLPDHELCVLQAGAGRRNGHACLLAAGTGLGQAFLFWDGARHHPMASEGGHADFAPQSEQETRLLAHLRAQFGHVSSERVLSGPGFFNIYTFLRDTGFAEEPAWLREKIQSGDHSVAVTEVALGDGHPLCTETLNLFVRLYGAAAGNLALHVLAFGGVYIGGGIAPKILPKLKDGAFIEAFTAKGRYTELLKGLRVCVALNPRAPLIGAAQFARQL